MRGNLGARWMLQGNTVIPASGGASLSLCKHYEQFSLLVLSTFDNVMSVISRLDGSCGVPLPLVTAPGATKGHVLKRVSLLTTNFFLWIAHPPPGWSIAVTGCHSPLFVNDCFQWPQTCFVTVGSSLAFGEFFTRGFDDSKVETD